MTQFQHICLLDETNLIPEAIEQLTMLSAQVTVCKGYPSSTDDILSRIGDADCMLVSWNTKVSAEVIDQAPHLQYIGMCCSLLDEASANVDIAAARAKGIVVKGVKDYGDEGVVEFVFSEIIRLVGGLGDAQWKPQATEISGKTLGIIGFGALGSRIATVATAFGMRVLYYSRTRKRAQESENVTYQALNELLSESDIVTTHLPRGVKLLGKSEFELTRPDCILVNTSLGPTYEIDAFLSWLQRDNHWAILDQDGAMGMASSHLEQERILFTDQVVGMTDRAYHRLSEKVLRTLKDYLADAN
ncbi:MAG: NAD(P)-dependent oxidoreductase [Bacteroidota bacterium]